MDAEDKYTPIDGETLLWPIFLAELKSLPSFNKLLTNFIAERAEERNKDEKS